MSVAATRKPVAVVPPKHDRIFYSCFSIAAALSVIVGFAPTYYARMLGSAPMHTVSGRPFTSLVYAHGAAFTTWILLFIAQTALIATHRTKVHMRLGIAGGVLAAAMVVLGLVTASEAARAGTAVPGTTPLQFFAIPFFDMVLFAVFIGLALWNRRNKEPHKRLMIMGYISIIPASVARWPGVLPLGPLGFYGFTMIFLVAAIAYDAFSRRRVHPVYIWGGTALLLSVPIRLALSGTHAWQSFAGWLTQRL
jgi:hypothetical protein